MKVTSHVHENSEVRQEVCLRISSLLLEAGIWSLTLRQKNAKSTTLLTTFFTTINNAAVSILPPVSVHMCEGFLGSSSRNRIAVNTDKLKLNY